MNKFKTMLYVNVRASPTTLAIIVGYMEPLRRYIKFVEAVRHFASMVLAILVGYNLKIVCY